jgi:DNA-binding NtrC family response regulator
MIPMPETRASIGQSVAERAWTRARERRAGLGELLAFVAAGLDRAACGVAIRDRLEEGLRRLTPARRIGLRDAIVGSGGAAGVIGLGALGQDRTPQGADSAVDSAPPLDDWDWQFLEGTRHLAALVFEIERMRAALGDLPRVARHARADETTPLVGRSVAMERLRHRVERIAATDFTVLIEGESGSGKELVARQIHHLSRRQRGPFVAVNCAALVESLLEAELFGIEDRTATGVRGRRGKFEHAEQGTLFLDEVSDLSMSGQAKLLRALQDFAVERVGGNGSHRVDVRVIAATNRNLLGLVEQGRFRLDLYYRLNGVEVHVPPLRGRRDDITELATYFLDRLRAYRRLTLSGSAIDALVAYKWPGNVRELERAMERAVALATSDAIELDDLPPAIAGVYNDILMPSMARSDSLRAWGSRYARLVLQRCGYNKRHACRVLGITYHTLEAHLRYRPEGQAPNREGAPRDGRLDVRRPGAQACAGRGFTFTSQPGDSIDAARVFRAATAERSPSAAGGPCTPGASGSDQKARRAAPAS